MFFFFDSETMRHACGADIHAGKTLIYRKINAKKEF